VPGEALDWTRWLAAFLGALAIGSAIIFALVLAIDPYDSGRFGLLPPGVRDDSPRTANASRARDPQFDSAVFGNSTGQLVSPAELSRLTGARFVQLTMPGSGPREQLAVLDFFKRHHPRIGAVVFVTDGTWCQHDPALPLQHPFPFWLYGDSTLDYLGHLFSSRALGRAWRRVQIALGRRERSAPDGYWNYELLGHREFDPVIGSQEEVAQPGTPGFFPAIVLLGAAINALPDVPVVLVVPPAFYTKVPRPGSAAAAEAVACKAALKSLVAGRPHSNFIDYFVDNAQTRDRGNFLDFGHYRGGLARQVEQGIADSIRLGNAAQIVF